MREFLLGPVKLLVQWRGLLRQWYLTQVYLPLVQRGQDMDQINHRLAHSNWRDTQLILRALEAQIHPTAYVESRLVFHNVKGNYRHFIVGAHSYIGKDCFFDLSDYITIKENVTVAMRVTILTHFDAGASAASRIYPRSHSPVTIEDGSYIGAGAILFSGIVVHADAIVAAGAVVTQDVPAKTMVGGVPARVIKVLNGQRGLEI